MLYDNVLVNLKMAATLDIVPELSQSRDENRVTISFVNLSYMIEKKKVKRTILDNLSGYFLSEKMTAVMGSSGSGKTSLLNAICGNTTNGGFLKGDVLVNYQSVRERNVPKNLWAFVFQEDVILDTMTVKEAITMSAVLRLPGDMPKETKQEHVDNVIELLDLKKCEDTIVGNPSKRGISGGERKRLAIAMEMIVNPPVIFLDEPTSGLDTFTAYQVMKLLKDLAVKSQRTIISTVHQPSSELFFLFDNLLLLNEGKLIYQGSVSDVVPYLKELGHVCPSYTNPADFLFLEVLNKGAINNAEEANTDLIKERIRNLENAYIEKQGKVIEDILNNMPKGSGLDLYASEGGKGKNGFVTQFVTQFRFLFGRAFNNAVRNKLMLQVKFFQTIVVALLAGLTFLRIPTRPAYAQVQDRTGALFFIVMNNVFNAAFGVLNVFGAEKMVFLREYVAGYYGLPAYYFSKTMVEMPFQLLFPLISAAVVYFMVQFQMTAEKFFLYAVTTMLLSITGSALGIFFASLFAELNVALAITPLFLLPLMLFSGLIVNNNSIPVYFNWIKYISPMKYGFAALGLNEFQGLSLPNPQPNSTMEFTGDIVIDQLGITDLSLANNIIILFALWIGLVILSYFALWRAVKQSQTKSRWVN